MSNYWIKRSRAEYSVQAFPTTHAAEPDLVPATGPSNRRATLGPHVGSEVNANFSADIDATASELVHEATHALHEDEYPASKRKITIDEEMRTNQNQLALYEDQRKGGFRDPELEQRRNDQANGKLRDNVRRRYPGTPEHL